MSARPLWSRTTKPTLPHKVPETTAGESKCCRRCRLRIACLGRSIIAGHPYLAPAHSPVSGPMFCAPHFGKHGSGRSDIRADAYVPTVRTGEVRNRPTSDRIGLFNGQSCLGKRDRFAAAGTIDHEVSFWLNDCHHGRQHSIILTKIRNKILVPHRGFQRLRQLARPIRTGQWYAPHTRGLVVNSVASTPFAA